ncbi:MAG: hypothetical protein K2N28_04085 [Muribaculaceae bacterium]|nr:hypothetical protein [Muribaculaceae bacterium]
MKKLSLILFAILIASIGNYCYAQRNQTVAKEIKEAFKARTDTVNARVIQFRETLISPEASDSAALIIFLHGASGRGKDNLSQLAGNAVCDIYNYLQRKNIHAYFIAPQCPETASWNGENSRDNRPRGNGMRPHRSPFEGGVENLKDNTPYIEHLMPFLEKYVSEHPISKSKIFIIGRSMGAAGTWLLIAKNPDYFQAALISSGGYRGKNIAPLLKTPVVCTVGTQENSYSRINELVGKLQSSGADATIVPIYDADHKKACDKSFTEENLDLLFSKHR